MKTTKTTTTAADRTAPAPTGREALVLAWVRATDALRALEVLAGAAVGLEGAELQTLRNCIEALDTDRPRLG